jgi:multidrug efflux pump subunit AcrB
MVADVVRVVRPTEVDHYQLRRTIDVYITTKGEALGGVGADIARIVAEVNKPAGVRVSVNGSVRAMNASFQSFGAGIILAILLVYLILVAQFRSFVDPFLILLAVPPGVLGVIVILVATGTTLNIMSLMGVIMMVGIVVSNSILIVEFTHRLIEEEGQSVREAVARACARFS